MTSHHLRATLPGGDVPVDLWLDAAGLHDSPTPAAQELPGAFAVPGGLVDAHFHATLDFEERGLTREQLIEANLGALMLSGVLAARDMGQAPDAPWLVERQSDRFS